METDAVLNAIGRAVGRTRGISFTVFLAMLAMAGSAWAASPVTGHTPADGATIVPVTTTRSEFVSSWQIGPPLIRARNQFTGTVIDGKIYVFGGNGNPNEIDLKSTEMLDPGQSTWVYKASNEHNGGSGVEEVSGATVNGKFYVFGANGDYGDFNFVEEYDPATNTWTSKAPMPTMRTGATAVAYNNKIYVFGNEHTDVVEAYDPVTNTWAFVTHMPKTLFAFAVAVVHGKAYVIGGASFDSEGRPVAAETDIYVYDFVSNSWAVNSGAPFVNLRAFPYSSAAPVVDGKIYLIGGGECPTDFDSCMGTDKVDIYDPVSNTWQTGVPLPVPTATHLAVVVNDDIYVVGGDGGGEPQVLTDAVWIYNTRQSVTGVCGNSNGMSLTQAPGTDLCKEGTATPVTGDGPWVWMCLGAGGGADAYCIANKQRVTYSLADLAGVWAVNGLETPGPWWAQGTFTFAPDGSFTGTRKDPDGSMHPLSGVFKMSPNGIITCPELNPTLRCVMDSGKSIITCTDTNDISGSEMPILTRKAVSYSQDDLTGDWGVNSISSPNGVWTRGTRSISADGSFISTVTLSDGSTYSTTGKGSISDGAAIGCGMDAYKTFLVCTDKQEQNGTVVRASMRANVKKAASYAPEDVVGVWRINNLVAPGPWWGRGMVYLTADGTYYANIKGSDGFEESESGSYSFTQDGLLTFSGMPSGECRMDAAKRALVCTSTEDSGDVSLMVLTSTSDRPGVAWPKWIAIRHNRNLQADGSWSNYSGDFEAALQVNGEALSVELLLPNGGSALLAKSSDGDGSWWKVREGGELAAFDSRFSDGVYIFRVTRLDGTVITIPVDSRSIAMPGEYPELSGIHEDEQWTAGTDLPLQWQPWTLQRQSNDVMLFVDRLQGANDQVAEYAVHLGADATSHLVPGSALPDNSRLHSWVHFANWGPRNEIIKQTASHVDFQTGTPLPNGSISGTVTYNGTQTGLLGVGVFTSPVSCTGPNYETPGHGVSPTSSGAYTIPNLPDGTYYVVSGVFTRWPNSAMLVTDPWGVYNGCNNITPVVISGGNAVTGVNITLQDGVPVQNPNPFRPAVNDACGGSNGLTLTQAPEANLCAKGTATAVTGDGPWAWSCVGADGVTEAYCVANKQSVTFSPADLAGVWNSNSIESPGPWWSQGTFTIVPDGTFTATRNASTGSIPSLSGRFNMTSDGIITSPDLSPTFRCAMDSGKSIITCTDTNEDGVEMDILTKKAADYSQDDLVGDWAVNAFWSPGVSWSRGTMSFSAEGAFSGTFINEEGASDSASGSVSITGDGVVALSSPVFLPSEAATMKCVMDAEKTVIVCTSTYDDGGGDVEAGMTVLTKKAASYAPEDIVGVWQMNILVSPTPSWNRGMIFYDTDDTNYANYVLPNGTVNSFSRDYTFSGDGMVEPARQCQMDSAKRLMVCARTYSKYHNLTILSSTFTDVAKTRQHCDTLYASQDFVAAAECYLGLAPPDKGRAADAYGRAGIVAYGQKNYQAALDFFILQIQYANLTTDYKLRGYAYYQAGYAAYALGKLSDSKNYYRQAGENFTQVPDEAWAADAYSHAGIVAYEQKDYQAALDFFLLQIRYASLTPDFEKQGWAYYQAAYAAHALGKLDESKNYYRKAGDSFSGAGKDALAADAYSWAENIAHEQGDLDSDGDMDGADLAALALAYRGNTVALATFANNLGKVFVGPDTVNDPFAGARTVTLYGDDRIADGVQIHSSDMTLHTSAGRDKKYTVQLPGGPSYSMTEVGTNLLKLDPQPQAFDTWIAPNVYMLSNGPVGAFLMMGKKPDPLDISIHVGTWAPPVTVSGPLLAGEWKGTWIRNDNLRDQPLLPFSTENPTLSISDLGNGKVSVQLDTYELGVANIQGNRIELVSPVSAAGYSSIVTDGTGIAVAFIGVESYDATDVSADIMFFSRVNKGIDFADYLASDGYEALVETKRVTGPSQSSYARVSRTSLPDGTEQIVRDAVNFRDYLRLTPQGYFLEGQDTYLSTVKEMRYHYSPPMIQAGRAMNIGSTLAGSSLQTTECSPSYPGSCPNPQDIYRENVIAGFEDVTVPAGTFLNCLKIITKNYTYDVYGGSLATYYAKGFGRVKWQNSSSTTELVVARKEGKTFPAGAVLVTGRGTWQDPDTGASGSFNLAFNSANKPIHATIIMDYPDGYTSFGAFNGSVFLVSEDGVNFSFDPRNYPNGTGTWTLSLTLSGNSITGTWRDGAGKHVSFSGTYQ